MSIKKRHIALVGIGAVILASGSVSAEGVKQERNPFIKPTIVSEVIPDKPENDVEVAVETIEPEFNPPPIIESSSVVNQTNLDPMEDLTIPPEELLVAKKAKFTSEWLTFNRLPSDSSIKGKFNGKFIYFSESQGMHYSLESSVEEAFLNKLNIEQLIGR